MIHVLPPHIASQIAAGEVIQRPASVIKELMENAVDSGADRIDVVLTDGGATLMQVTDNGCGMGPDDALLAFERHATSKIREVEDLQNVHTFGFRGEALASIASVSHVKLRSRRKEDEMGTEISIAGSAVTSQEEVVCSPGSDFSVRNLFYNVPARRRFLKSEAVEMRHILEEFHRVVLCHPERTFTLTHNGNAVYHLPACDNLRSRITGTLGKELNAQLLDLNVDTSMVRIKGYVGRPRDAYKKGGHRYFFVNGRFFKSAYLHKAVIRAYGKLLPEDRVPTYFIYLGTDPEIIDVNIHPTKTEVKFQDEEVIFQMLQAAIRETLGKFALGPSIDFEIGAMQHHIPVPPAPGEHISPPRLCYDPLFDPFRETPGETSPILFEEQPLQTYENQVIPLKKKYLITPVASGLLIVHRQRALERIYYEELLPKFRERKPVPEKLYFPVALNLQPSLSILLEQNRDRLFRMGFETDDKHNVTAVPPEHPTDGPSVIASVREILTELEEEMPEDKYGERLSILLAKRMAAEDQENSQAAYRSLIDRLFACNEPNNTPDGRSCMTLISLAEIDKYFT
ncbi:MAG: DNA mismatch repair endonuclease MutL [Bacteroidales bacterium]|jgi:DNA mismatch repair protein MutL|nr:DNA mismatch repair endonuclease MutL [Bacteroidales bacterium]MDD2263542.1 DNA mismatch repair endonuclease MutL [Bacteroidales bacterium]MDD2830667.1 DNA mismatch repair endonuclease MutL [Bacteroidales bacterium]MDD3207866.1 DNA mismatch repair endonuclease MutL [Bacteroidales bacterium]MDD3696626.1 DNA mismatch repair endonuclease MutL [Bacteroidales bacterium]